MFTKTNRIRISTMFSADAKFQIRARFSSAFSSDFYQFADTFDINGDERIALDKTAFKILGKKISSVIAA